MIDPGRRITVSCVLNGVSAGCIPLESFCRTVAPGLFRRVLALDSTSAETDVAVGVHDSSNSIEIRASEAHGRRTHPKVWRRFIPALSAPGPHVIHAHHRASALATALYLRVFHPRYRFIYTLHGNLNRPGSRGYRPVQLLIMALSHAIVCNSRATADSIPGFFKFLKDRVSVIHNGLDLNAVEAVRSKSTYDPDSGRYTICTVGRLVNLKRFDLLIEAVAEVRQRCDRPIRLIVVGEGPQRARLEDVAARTGLAGVVSFTGPLARRDVYEILSSANLFVMPSISEGFCNAVVEAMGMGLPVLCSDIPALREVVGSDSGRLIPPGDGPALTEALSWFIANPREGLCMGRSGRERAEATFSLDANVRRHIELYEHVMGVSLTESTA